MQQVEQKTRMGGTERKRVEAVVETLAHLGCRGETVAEVAHDARNMVTALGLYCDLLEEPGVLASPFAHYGNELRLVAAASRRLVEKLVALDAVDEVTGEGNRGIRSNANPVGQGALRRLDGTVRRWPVNAGAASRLEPGRAEIGRRETAGHWDLLPAAPIGNMAVELLANHNLLAAIAGPAITVTVDAEGGARPVRLTSEDLTRVLVNLVKNAAEAMPGGGRIQIELREIPAGGGTADALALTVDDNGSGIAQTQRETIFESGFTTRAKSGDARGRWAGSHRGLGLSITRSIVEAAGGRIQATNRAGGGARLEIELPVWKQTF